MEDKIENFLSLVGIKISDVRLGDFTISAGEASDYRIVTINNQAEGVAPVIVMPWHDAAQDRSFFVN